MKLCKVAIIQHPPVFLNLAQSIAKACDHIMQAAQQGARIIAFPETWLPGYPVWLDEAPNAALWHHAPALMLYRVLVDNAITLPSPELEQLLAVAHRAGAHVIMGAHEQAGGTLYNTTIYISPDASYRIHRKLIPTYTERLVWGQGDGSTLSVVETEYGVLGGLICWEHWMPLARAAMHAKHEAIHVAQWPTVKDTHQVASRHYAFEGQCFVLAAGTMLTRDDVLAGFDSLALGESGAPARELLASIPDDEGTLIQSGGSAIITPQADYLAGPVFADARIVYAVLDSNLITQGHLTLDTNGHYARPDVFQLTVNEQPLVNVKFNA